MKGRGLLFGVMVALVAGSQAGGLPVQVARATAPRVSGVSNPPTRAIGQFRLQVKGSVTAVSVYAAAGRRLTPGAVRLARVGTLHGGRVTVKVPATLAPGMWFVIACPVGRRTGCAASHRGMYKAPTRFARPISARPVLEAAHAASTTLGPAGGTLDATAADGTHFHLAVHAGSVPDGTAIRMTPLSSLTSAKWFGRLAGGVALAPEGLVLVHGATLTIGPRRGVPIGKQIAVGYTGVGADLHQVPLAPTRSAIEIPLSHFSGAAVGDGGGGGATPPAGASAAGFTETEIGGLVGQWRDGAMSDADFQSAADTLLSQWYRDIMATDVPPGLGDDGAADHAIADLLRYAYLSAFLLDKDVLPTLAPTLRTLLEGKYHRAQDRCANQHDLGQIDKIVAADRAEQLLALPGHPIEEDFKCLKFRLDFDSLATVLPQPGLTGSLQLEYVVHVPLAFDVSQLAVTGQGTGSYATLRGSFNLAGQVVMTPVSGSSEPFAVLKFTYTNPQTVIVEIGKPVEHMTGLMSGTTGLWNATWTACHPGPGAAPTWTGLSLSPGAGSLVARGTWSCTSSLPGAYTATENTSIDIFHTP